MRLHVTLSCGRRNGNSHRLRHVDINLGIVYDVVTVTDSDKSLAIIQNMPAVCMWLEPSP
jgi:hypothetical protein